jgi:hypothetical protein
VEFGIQLLLGESESGVILDWELVNGRPDANTKMLQRSWERLGQSAAGRAMRQMGGDRGFDSKANRALLLKGAGIDNGICPQAPAELAQRLQKAAFVNLRQRRSQTEARLSIFKNGFWVARY